MEAITNRVANSALLAIDLDDYIDTSERTSFDLKQTLFQELLLREKDFRDFIKGFEWEMYRGKNVHVHCTSDAIIPSWAFMLVASKLTPIANIITVGESHDLERAIIDKAIDKLIAQSGIGELKARHKRMWKLTKS